MTEGFQPQWVNHSQKFCRCRLWSQNICERLWRDIRAGIPRFGCSQKHVVRYVAEFENSSTTRTAFTRSSRRLWNYIRRHFNSRTLTPVSLNDLNNSRCRGFVARRHISIRLSSSLRNCSFSTGSEVLTCRPFLLRQLQPHHPQFHHSWSVTVEQLYHDDTCT